MPARCWAPAGIRPIAPQQIIREYTYVYGMIIPEEGIFDGLILPDMSAETMTIFLEEISERHPDRYILMVIDGAPCHSAGVLKIPDNIKILTLPPYSPQLNPTENLWDEMREKWFCNCVFKDMNAVEDRLVEAILDFESDPKRMKSITAWDWIMQNL
jgi:transposase